MWKIVKINESWQNIKMSVNNIDIYIYMGRKSAI
jgi:hypothetical protein